MEDERKRKKLLFIDFFHLMVKDESKNDVHDINAGTLVVEVID